MIPEDFFKTCELLLDHDEEPHRRTIVGRAYYAAFLYFREYLKTRGLTKKLQPRNEAHEFVIQCLGFSNVREASIASAQLQDLQQKRHDADYDLGREVSQADAEDALCLGKSIISCFEKSVTPEAIALLVRNATAHAKLRNWIR